MVAVIEVKDLEYTYQDGTKALDGISFKIEEGSRVALLGPNGAGKSTLFLHLNGLQLPQRGSVEVLGKEVKKKVLDWLRAKVGVVFQDPDDQIFSSTVWDDVAFGPTNMGLSDEEISLRTEKALQAVSMLQYKDKPPYRLSYGQKKRVSIAGIIAMEPEIIILDEPMAYLDPCGKKQVIDILELLSQKGITIIIATHDVDLAARWADKLIILKEGQILAVGKPNLLADKKLVAEAGLTHPIVTEIFLAMPELQVAPLPITVEEAVREMRKINPKKV